MSLEAPTLRECSEAWQAEGGGYPDDANVVIGPCGIMLDKRYGPGKRWHEIYDRGLCTNCGIRPGTRVWGDSLALTHGGGQKRCDLCVLRPQIEHALNRTKALPSLFIGYLRAWVLDVPRKLW